MDNYLSDLAEDRDRHSTLLICLRGEVPVVLDSPTEVASFYFASKDDVVCIDDQGRVRLLSSVNRGNISEPRSVTPNSNDETGMLFINDISIDDNSEYGNSGTDSSSVRPTQSSSCRLVFKLGTVIVHSYISILRCVGRLERRFVEALNLTNSANQWRLRFNLLLQKGKLFPALSPLNFRNG